MTIKGRERERRDGLKDNKKQRRNTYQTRYESIAQGENSQNEDSTPSHVSHVDNKFNSSEK